MIGLKTYLGRNKVSIGGVPSRKNCINLEWWAKKKNVGDYLSEVIYNYMLEYNNLDPNKIVSKTIHLMAVGSLVGMYEFDSVVWGSGIHCVDNIKNVYRQSKYRKYDIRLLRGPITGEIMKSAGYQVPNVYADPAVIMPLIYKTDVRVKEYEVSVILHLSQKQEKQYNIEGLHYIDVETHDYKKFIDEIIKSKMVVSSSLHGIILAESYGVPAIFLKSGMNNEMLKFYDWYFSTDRYNVVAVNSISEALTSEKMQLPDIKMMQKNVIETFPKDLWKVK